MRTAKTKLISDLLATEDEHLKKLNEIVLQSIEQEKLLLQNVAAQEAEKLSLGQRLADRVAKFGGSWKFIIAFALVLAGWITINLIFVGRDRFDPYPFILLNLLLSCLAAIQAPVIMMSQNRQAAIDRKAAEHDYVVNLRAELEIMLLHDKLDALREGDLMSRLDVLAAQLESVRAEIIRIAPPG
jgi:uncharacterized membrane protein